MVRGRPVKSQVRQNILEILYYLKQGYGYQISRIYNEVFPQVTQRLIYYHLRKGILTGEIIVQRVEQEKGNFSWGGIVEKTYYTLGSQAIVRQDARVKEFLARYQR